VKISVKLSISAPPEIVFRFYTRLDHLRFISPRFRYEWCTKEGAIVAEGSESEVKIQQHRHKITVRFRTVRLEDERFIEDEFLTWPVKGARHTVRLEPSAGGTSTSLEDVIVWDAPWYLRRVLERYVDEQRRFFEERQANAKRIIEAVYAARGADAFRDGIFADAASVGIEPVVPATP
jgi:ligand-binding SRPBCC domain-containing protein